MKLAKKHNDCFFGLYSNSTLINDEMCEQIRELGNITFMLSIEGTPDTNDARRGEARGLLLRRHLPRDAAGDAGRDEGFGREPGEGAKRLGVAAQLLRELFGPLRAAMAPGVVAEHDFGTFATDRPAGELRVVRPLVPAAAEVERAGQVQSQKQRDDEVERAVGAVVVVERDGAGGVALPAGDADGGGGVFHGGIREGWEMAGRLRACGRGAPSRARRSLGN